MRLSHEWLRGAWNCLIFAGASGGSLVQAGAQVPGDRVAAYGQVTPGERIMIVAVPHFLGAPQVVEELLVKEGDRVARHQKLAGTNNRALAAADVALAQARLQTFAERLNAVQAGPKRENLAAQEASVKSLEADAQAEKARKPAEAGSKSREALARAEALDWKTAAGQHQLQALRAIGPAEVAVAQAEVAEAQAAVTRAEVLLRATEIISPADGQILKILAYPGEGTAGPGLLELGETSAMQIKAELNVADASRVKPGARATVKSEAWLGELAGTVTRLRPRVERSLLSPPSTFSNVDRIIVEATIVPDTAEKLAGLSGAEVTVLITAEPASK